MNDILTPCPGHNPNAPRPGDPVWCRLCTHFLYGELAALPGLARALRAEVGNASRSATERVSGSHKLPIHEYERYTFCAEEIDGILDSWADVVREDRHLAAGRHVPRQLARISASTTFLLTHFDWLIAEHPDLAASETFGKEVRRVYRKARKLSRTDDVRPEPCDGIACAKCDLLMLEREIDWQGRATGYIACANCGDLMTAAEYERWVKLLAAPLRKRSAA